MLISRHDYINPCCYGNTEGVYCFALWYATLAVLAVTFYLISQLLLTLIL